MEIFTFSGVIVTMFIIETKGLLMCLSERKRNQAVIYLLKVNKRNFRARYEVVLVFLLLTLNM